MLIHVQLLYSSAAREQTKPI